MEMQPTVVVAEVVEDSALDADEVGPPGCGCLTTALGVVLVLIGIPMLVCPGPGIATIALGSGLVITGMGLRSRGR